MPDDAGADDASDNDDDDHGDGDDASDNDDDDAQQDNRETKQDHPKK